MAPESQNSGAIASVTETTAIQLTETPDLIFRECYVQLQSYLNSSLTEQESLDCMNTLYSQMNAFLDPFHVIRDAKKYTKDQIKEIKLNQKKIEISALVQNEITKWSEEYGISEKTCFYYWILASDAKKRQYIEQIDRLEENSITDSIAVAARYFFNSEMEYKLCIVRELVRITFNSQTHASKRYHLLYTLVSELVRQGLGSQIIKAAQFDVSVLLKNIAYSESAALWLTILTETLLFFSAAYHMSAEEILDIVELAKSACLSMKAVLSKVSPHLVNLSSMNQLLQAAPIAGTSPMEVVKQVGYILQSIITMFTSFVHAISLKQTEKRSKETGNWNETISVFLSDSAKNQENITKLHAFLVSNDWEHEGFQGLFQICFAGFLANAWRNKSPLFLESSQAQEIAARVIEKNVFRFSTELLKHYSMDKKQDTFFYTLFQSAFELVFRRYCSSLLLPIPTLSDQLVMEELHANSDNAVMWKGDCLEHFIDFAVTLCSRNPSFSQAFWPSETMETDSDVEDCHAFLIAARDAAFKNPACFSAYMQLIAAAAIGDNCAPLAFQHIKQNPTSMNWDHFFSVMTTYYRLLTASENTNTISHFSPHYSLTSMDKPKSFARQIRPEELEALESIQLVLQCVIRDTQLALIFFHNHDWSPIPSLSNLLQCRVPSSLKGAIMKSLAIFARVPDIAPSIWRQLDSLQILRTKKDSRTLSVMDISYELEHFESVNGLYPATRGFLALLYQLFETLPLVKDDSVLLDNSEQYLSFLLHAVFLKLSIRKYEDLEEKWSITSAVLSIFKRIVHVGRNETSGASIASVLATRLLKEFYSNAVLLDRIMHVFMGDGGLSSLEDNAIDLQLTHAFRYCREYVSKQTEKQLGPLHYANDASFGVFSKLDQFLAFMNQPLGSIRERTVQYALELIILLLEQETESFHVVLCRNPAKCIGILQYIRYSRSAYIAELSTVVLRHLSARVSGIDVIHMFQDSNLGHDVLYGYLERLQTENEFVKRTEPEKESILMPYEMAETTQRNESLQRAILTILYENIQRPMPNFAHLFLGLHESNWDFSRGLTIILSFLCSKSNGALHERCHQLVYHLLEQSGTAQRLLSTMEETRFDFCAQLETILEMTEENASLLSLYGHFLRSFAAYVYAVCNYLPSQYKSLERAVALLTNASESPILHLLHACLVDAAPPIALCNHSVLERAEESIVMQNSGAYRWLSIDLKMFCKRLQSSISIDSQALFLSEKEMEKCVLWATQWNTYTETVAAVSFAIDSWRMCLEMVFFRGPMDDGALSALADSILMEILQVIGNCREAQVFETLAQCVLVCSAQRVQQKEIANDILENIVCAIVASKDTIGNANAARQGRTALYCTLTYIEKAILPSPILTQALCMACNDAMHSQSISVISASILALETFIHLESDASVRFLIERGWILQCIDLYSTSDESTVNSQLLSFFTALSVHYNGANALFKGGIVRVMEQKHITQPLQRLILQLFSCICASLHENRSFAVQLFCFFVSKPKLFSILKEEKAKSAMETAYLSFILNFLIRFPELQMENTISWPKLLIKMENLLLNTNDSYILYNTCAFIARRVMQDSQSPLALAVLQKFQYLSQNAANEAEKIAMELLFFSISHIDPSKAMNLSIEQWNERPFLHFLTKSLRER